VLTRAGRSLLVALLLAMAAAGCASERMERSRPGAPPADPRARLGLSVVALDALIGRDRVHGSGIVIDAARGLVVTTARGVWGARSLRVGSGLGVLYGRIVARDPCVDLAVVQLQPRLPGLEPLPAGDGVLPPGTWATAVGRRWSGAIVDRENLVLVPVRVMAAAGRGGRLDTTLPPDSLGGPLLDRRGRLTGLAVGDAGRTRALPWSAVARRLAALRPGPRATFVGWREAYRCAGRLHRAALAAHPGYRREDARLNAPVPITRLPGAEELDR
jgi:S1-C subfamily serine protease